VRPTGFTPSNQTEADLVNHLDGILGAFFNTSFTVGAFVSGDKSFAVNHVDGFGGASIDTGFAAVAFCWVNESRHFGSSRKKLSWNAAAAA